MDSPKYSKISQSTSKTNAKVVNDDIKLSKKLSWLLRHGAAHENLPIEATGYININHILNHKLFKNHNFNDIIRVVENDNKNRYKILNENNIVKIKANQGHSIVAVNELNLKKIINYNEIPLAVHGTYKNFWLNNIKLEGLKRMQRNHIHFAIHDRFIKLNNNCEITSGIRNNCEILIYLNVKLVLENNIPLCISENNVVLTFGENGILKPKYFEKVIDRKTNQLLTS